MENAADQPIRYAIGFDIGGTKIEGAVVSDRGQVLRNLRLPTPADYASMQKTILEIFDRVRGDEKILGVGFGIPGSIDEQTHLLRNAPNSPAINNTDFFAKLQSQLPYAMKCENDANCLALSEFVFGAAKGCRHVVGIIMGTGVGSGVVIDGRLFTGSRGLAPELGHSLLTAFDGRKCGCGNCGCVEAYLSGPSVMARYREAGGAQTIRSAGQIFAHAKDDPIAKKIVAETLYLFSRFMAVLISIYDPEVIVLGGGMSKQDVYYQCQAEIAAYAFGTDKIPPIKRAAHGDASGKLGAAALFFI